MKLCSILFLCFFFPIFYIIYYLIPKRYQNYWILLGSLFFIIFGRNSFIWYFLLISIITYFGMFLISNLPKKISKKKISYWVIGILIFIWFLFIREVKTSYGISYPICYGIILLQNIVSLREFTKQNKKLPIILDYFTYSSFFPKLLLGPIVSYFDMEEDLKGRTISKTVITEGFFNFLRGVFEQVLLVGSLSVLREALLISPISILSSWLLLLTTMLIIILFFISYSHMTIGLSLMLGFTFSKEFDYPFSFYQLKDLFNYFQISIKKIYINMVSKLRLPYIVKSILLLFLISLTYGINVNILLWILGIGIGIVLEKIFIKKSYFFGHLWFFLSFVFLVRPSMEGIRQTFTGLFDIFHLPFITIETGYYFRSYFIILLVSIFISLGVIKWIVNKIEKKSLFHLFRDICYFILLFVCFIYLVSNSYIFGCFGFEV